MPDSVRPELHDSCLRLISWVYILVSEVRYGYRRRLKSQTCQFPEPPSAIAPTERSGKVCLWAGPRLDAMGASRSGVANRLDALSATVEDAQFASAITEAPQR